MTRKRRTVLWLFSEDYEFLSRIAQNDSDSKNKSLTRLIRWLRQNKIESFIQFTAKKAA